MPVSLWFSDASSVVRGYVFNFIRFHGELVILLVGVGRGRSRGRSRSRTGVEMALPAVYMHLATDLLGDP